MPAILNYYLREIVMAKVAVIMGSKSDLPVVKQAIDVLKNFGVEVEARVISAHRTPDEAHAYAKSAKDNGVEVIICAAGKAAHLGGVIAAYTTLPVIGLPIKTDMMGGLDSLLSIVQMPSGIPVATVGVNGGENAGLLALQILGIKYPEISKKLIDYKQKMKDKINSDDAALQSELSNI
jgi:5-(carboxyamino)imidazole ribonucleotide mutase